MPALARSLEQTYEATAASVAKARSAVGRLAANGGATEQQVESVRLAVSEAVTNAVLHGHRGSPGEVRLRAEVSGGALWISVTDDGCGIGVPSAQPGMGIGLGIIAEVADHMSVAPRASGGTELRMRFDLVARPGARAARYAAASAGRAESSAAA